MIRSAVLLLTLSLFGLFAGCGEQEKPQQDLAVSDPLVKRQPVPDSGLKIAAWNLQWFPGKAPGGLAAEDYSKHISAVISELKSIPVQEPRCGARVQGAGCKGGGRD